MATQTKRVAVVGGAGYAGIELVRFLLGHPGFELIAVTSDGDAGKPLTELYPALIGKTQLTFSPHSAIGQLTKLDAAFLAVPHTAAMKLAPALLAQGTAVFDLSADFRLNDATVYEKWYGTPHTAPELLPSAIYGLPELNRPLLAKRGQEFRESTAKQAQQANFALVACSGCYPTASTLAAAPVLVADFAAEGPVVINAISGVSGAGRAPSQGKHFCTVNENVNAYGVATHRHTPEIAQIFAWQAGRQVPVVFTPHLAPLTRGLLSTVTIPIKSGVSAEHIVQLYAQAYEVEPFVHVLDYGTMPQTASVVGTNNAQVGIMLDEAAGVLVASCAIDNLGKGAASQAIQCANIVFGYSETSGLTSIPEVV
jgi:N-acetyl-gamma-glutamyl-phosphate reductase